MSFRQINKKIKVWEFFYSVTIAVQYDRISIDDRKLLSFHQVLYFSAFLHIWRFGMNENKNESMKLLLNELKGNSIFNIVGIFMNSIQLSGCCRWMRQNWMWMFLNWSIQVWCDPVVNFGWTFCILIEKKYVQHMMTTFRLASFLAKTISLFEFNPHPFQGKP